MRGKLVFASILIVVAASLLVASCILTKHFLDPTQMQSLDDLTAQLDEHMADMLVEWNTPGVAVAFIENGQIVWSKGYGVRQVGTTDPVTADTTLFQAASISKPVATWGLMRLTEPTIGGADEPLVDIDEPVNNYLTRWQLHSLYDWNPAWVSEVTLRLILGHRAGLNLSGYLGWPPEECCPTLEESLEGDDNNPLAGPVRIWWEPNTMWAYSGGGIAIMQLVMEEVTQQDFGQYMYDSVLTPLGMLDSSYTYSDAMLPDLATPYDSSGNELPNYLFVEKAVAGLYTTAEDLARFAAAAMTAPGLEPGRGVLQPKTVDLITTCYPDPGMAECTQTRGWGLGYEVFKENGYFVVGHTGGNRGWKAVFRFVRDLGIGMVVLTNSDAGVDLYEEIEWAWLQFYLH